MWFSAPRLPTRTPPDVFVVFCLLFQPSKVQQLYVKATAIPANYDFVLPNWNEVCLVDIVGNKLTREIMSTAFLSITSPHPIRMLFGNSFMAKSARFLYISSYWSTWYWKWWCVLTKGSWGFCIKRAQYSSDSTHHCILHISLRVKILDLRIYERFPCCYRP